MNMHDHDAPTSHSMTDVQYKRPRSSIACCRCRGRKVRCDASVSGAPCTNCTLDQAPCKLLPGRKRSRSVFAKNIHCRNSDSFYPGGRVSRYPILRTCCRDISSLSHRISQWTIWNILEQRAFFGYQALPCVINCWKAISPLSIHVCLF